MKEEESKAEEKANKIKRLNEYYKSFSQWNSNHWRNMGNYYF